MSIDDSLALKYRPKKLDDVIGQPVVVKAFKNAFKTNTLHHAYILAGQFGCGKTSVARIIAAMENCEEGFGKDPCGVCENCKEIFAGRSLEVREMDAASVGKVDEIRALQRDLSQSPIKCRTKYVIIDEAHSLTRQAAEASLKMIEEPPKFVRFILCTTEPQSFKPTIHSRCITWSFSKVSWTEIFHHLKSIVEKQSIPYEEKALQIAARYSKGSVRNGMQNLQRLINFVGGMMITAKDAAEALGAVDDTLYFEFMNGIIRCDTIHAFKAVNDILKDGKQINVVIDGLYEHLNNLLIARVCNKDISSFDFSEMEVKRYTAQTKQVSVDLLLKMMNLLNTVAFGVEYSLDPEKLLNKFIVESLKARKIEKVSS